MSKKLIPILIITLITVFTFAFTASADTAKVTASALNIRQAPSTNAPVIGVLTSGTAVEVVASDGAWCKINYGGNTGYIYSSYITFARENNPTSRSIGVCGRDIVEYAKTLQGIPYVYGGTSTAGFDCSGYVQYVYKHFGINLPRTSYSQMGVGTSVGTGELMPGDLLFFRGGGHVGIYVGNGSYIHAPQTGRTVSIDSLTYVNVCAARRIIR